MATVQPAIQSNSKYPKTSALLMPTHFTGAKTKAESLNTNKQQQQQNLSQYHN